VQSTFKGPTSRDYLEHDEIENASLVWSPCGAQGMLNINSQVLLTSPNHNAQGMLTVDSIDTKFTQILHIQWRKC
jgi:hypothetical protein